MDKELHIGWMYPDILSLHGDRGNNMAFKNIGEKLGLNVKIHRVNQYGMDIEMEKMDIIFLSSGELRVMSNVIEDLTRYKEVLKNKLVIAIGTSGSILAKETVKQDNIALKGLGILDMVCKERKEILGDDLYFKIADFEIIGSQIQMIDTELKDVEPLGIIEYGYGNEGSDKEGAQYKDIIFTNCLGPVFVKNPWYTESIIKRAMAKKGVEIEENIPEEDYDYEINSLEAMKSFINQKRVHSLVKPDKLV